MVAEWSRWCEVRVCREEVRASEGERGKREKERAERGRRGSPAPRGGEEAE